MPARNIIWRSYYTSGDGWRYFWEIRPAHADAYDSPEVRTLPGYALSKGFKIRKGHAKIAAGLQLAQAVELEIKSRFLDADLKSAITDGGQTVYTETLDIGTYSYTFSVEANTVWTLYTDAGDGELDWDEFTTIVTEGVQVPQMGDRFNHRDRRYKITLLDPVKYLAEKCPVGFFCADMWANVGYWGGDATYPTLVKDRVYEFAFIDDDDRPHALAEIGIGDEAVLVSWTNVIGHVMICLAPAYNKLLRGGLTSITFDAWTTNGTTESHVVVDPEPLDQVTTYKKSLLPDGDRGDVLDKADRMVIGWIRETGESPAGDGSDITGGVLHPRNGLPSTYKTIWKWLENLTGDGVARGCSRFGITSPLSAHVAYLEFRALWHKPVVGDTMPDSGRYTKVESVRAPSVVQSAISHIEVVRGEDVSEFETVNDGSNENGPAIESFFFLHTVPSVDTEDNIGITEVPSDAVITIGDTDFSGTDKFILHRIGYTLERFYYVQSSTHDGGPSWITADGEDEIVIAAHHTVDLGLAGFAGDYELPDTIIAYDIAPTTGYEDQDYSYYITNLWDKWRFNLTAQQLVSWPAQVAYAYARIFGNKDSVDLEVEVMRPHPFTPDNALRIFPLRSSFFESGAFPQSANQAAIVEAEYDISGGRTDKITFTVRGTSQ